MLDSPHPIHDIICLRGAPGVGKSTTALALAALIHGSSVVEVDNLRGDLCASGLTWNWTDDHRHEIAIVLAASISEALLSSGARTVIVVDTFADPNLALFKRNLKGQRLVWPVALVSSEEALRHRLRTRQEAPGVFRDAAVSLPMNDAFRASPVTADATLEDPAGVARRLLAPA